LTNINNQVGNISLNTLNATYNDFKKVNQLTESTSNKQFNFVYGNDEERIKMDYKVNSVLQYERYYTDNYDKQENANNTYKEWNYINSPNGLVAIYYNNNGSGQLIYVQTDHLGSPVLLTDPSGVVLEEYSFDAWGRRRNPANWNDNTSGITNNIMIRGYTGHEHLDEVGIINMNGRIYDPVLGRFLQPDAFVQAPQYLQNYNRYSYVMNNPLKYTDPSGYEFSDLNGAFGNFFNGLFGAQNMGSGFNPNIQGNAQIAADIAYKYSQVSAKIQLVAWSVAISAGTVGLGTMIGITGFVPGAIYGGISGAATGGLTGGARAYINDEDVEKGAKKGAMWGGIIGGVSGGISGGIDATKHGRNFWTGRYSTRPIQNNLLASAKEIPYSEKQSYLKNENTKKAFFKPEDGSTGYSDYVGSGKELQAGVKIDGVATLKYGDQVYKVPDGYGAFINKSGEVSIYLNEPIYGPGLWVNETFRGYEYGWQAKAFFGADTSWDTLFKFATLINFFK
jgi:RHS repeat-associated protein